MAKRDVKRSPKATKPAKRSCLVQTHVTEAAHAELGNRAEREGMSMAAYVRRLIIRDLGM